MGACAEDATYTWYFGGAVVGTGKTLSIPGATMAKAGTYTVVVVCGETECDGEDTAELIVNPNPVVTANGDEVCEGEDALLSASHMGACAEDATYTWYFGGAVVGTGKTLSIPGATMAKAGTYTVVVVCGETECDGEDTAELVVNPNPDATITGETDPCVDETVTYTAPAGSTTYTWYVDGVQKQSGPSNTFDWTATDGAHVIKVVVVNQYGCEAEDEIEVTGRRGDLEVLKFEDTNGNGVRDTDEPVLEGWRMVVKKGDVVVAEGDTDTNGYITFTLPCGDYVVNEILKDGWVLTTAEYVSVTVTLEETAYAEFGNFQCFEIFGFKWNDLNGDGTWDQGEPPIPGWKIGVGYELTPASNNGLSAMLLETDENGRWSFRSCSTQTWTITEEQREGWVPTTVTRYVVSGTSGIDLGPYNFGNFQCYEVSGFKWDDLNGNGIWDQGEPPIAGWEITLDGQITATTTITGYWSFQICDADEHVVAEELRQGWMPKTVTSYTFSSTSGEDVGPLNFGNFQCVEIFGYKWNDLNSNGVWDAGEPPIEGWEITISTPPPTPPNGDLYETAIGLLTTDENGRWSFVACGSEPWTISEEQRAGWVPTTVTFYQVVVSSGQELEAMNFGNFQCYEVSGHKWNDLNGNGMWDQGEPAIAGWEITLDGTMTTTTDVAGYWSLQICDADEHVVSEEQRQGWVPTTPTSITFSSTSGMNVGDLDFGNFQCYEVSGHKWEDLNGDGIWQKDVEPVIEGWQITLDGTDVALTDANGRYAFTICDANEHTVVEEQRTAWLATTPTSITFSSTSGEDVSDLDFGNQQVLGGPRFLRGIKFWDMNGNGRNDTEPGLAGITILIKDGAGNLLAELLTGPGGAWVYEEPLRPGRYVIEEVVPTDWVRTYPMPNNGIYLVDVVDLGPIVDWVLVSPEPVDWNGSLDFGNARPMGFKFHDRNANGRRDGNEELLGNWRILLKDMDFNIVFETYTVAKYGDPFHGYWFLGGPLPEGEYYVVEAPQPGWTQTYPAYIGYKIYLRADGSYDVLSAPQSWMDGLSFGNWQGLAGSCPICVEWAVFQSDRVDDNWNIFRMDLNGGNVLQLTEDLAADVSPSWKFDGSGIAFATQRDGDWEIYTMTPDGEMERNVINRPDSTELEPSWNCQWIAFQSDRDGNWEIYKVDPEVLNGPQIRLTDNPAADVAPAWSPDESTIAFQSNRDGNWEIYLMSSEGEQVSLRRLTNHPAVDRNPAWIVTKAEAQAIREGKTGDYGKWVVFESDRAEMGKFDLYKMHIVTGEIVRLTAAAADSMDPAGMPYCDLILFETDRDGSLMDVWRMDLDGLNERNITLNDVGPDYWSDHIDEIPGYNLGYLPPEQPVAVIRLPLIIR
jgi:hypothetical protein